MNGGHGIARRSRRAWFQRGTKLAPDLPPRTESSLTVATRWLILDWSVEPLGPTGHPVPLPRFATLDPSRRAAILGAAVDEFARAGLEGASYNRIIAGAGVSKGAMYYYFDNKEDLLLTVLADLAERSAAAIGELGAVRDVAGFWAEVKALNARAIAFFLGDPNLARLAKQLMRSAPGAPLGLAIADFTRRIEAYTAGVLHRGQAVGAVRTDLPLELLAHLCTGLGESIDRWLFTRWESLAPADMAALPDLLVDLFMRLVAPLPPGAGARDSRPKRTKR